MAVNGSVNTGSTAHCELRATVMIVKASILSGQIAYSADPILMDALSNL